MADPDRFTRSTYECLSVHAWEKTYIYPPDREIETKRITIYSPVCHSSRMTSPIVERERERKEIEKENSL